MTDNYQDPNVGCQPRMEVPAPWELRGSAYICFLRCPNDLLVKHAFIQDSLKDRWVASAATTLLIYVNYEQSPVGPYHELFIIPGRFRCNDDATHLSISRIFVSSMDSVINGRNNWGIPKEIANFEVTHHNNTCRVSVTNSQRDIATLTFNSQSITLSFTSALLPKRLTSLGQERSGETFIFCPKASGWLRKAELGAARINPKEFPPITTEQSLGAIYLPRFK